MEEVYYVVYTTGEYYGQKCPVYVQLVKEGRMLQGSLYDASKFNKKSNAHQEKIYVSQIFKDKTFEVIPVDKRIFGEMPRFVED